MPGSRLYKWSIVQAIKTNIIGKSCISRVRDVYLPRLSLVRRLDCSCTVSMLSNDDGYDTGRSAVKTPDAASISTTVPLTVISNLRLQHRSNLAGLGKNNMWQRRPLLTSCFCLFSRLVMIFLYVYSCLVRSSFMPLLLLFHLIFCTNAILH